jgi:hypothetical protein
VKFGVIVDVEASRSIRQGEVGDVAFDEALQVAGAIRCPAA